MSLPIPLIGSVVLGLTNFLALVVLGLSAYTLNAVVDSIGVYFTYSALGVATAVLHLIYVTATVIVDRLRVGAFTSKLSVQVGFLSFLSIMWLATGAETAATTVIFIGCNEGVCGATRAIAAFGFFNWAILLGYVILLIALGVRAGQAGHNVWMTDVKEIQWVQEPVSYEKGDVNSPNPTVATTYPPNSGVPILTSQPQQYDGNVHV
ncbi:hypothetical protein BDM02DRAFT_3186113 [Thelephora ganbajun]|uniref:Uncharacterized protein n=1 Tax=Thelephora ganbajun TaxID=370292 RepID=A0ACB6ZJW5_THEGA|nr:hypothetical protein BDM02DRAFT_3186113 [Thelephora ganbajun]